MESSKQYRSRATIYVIYLILAVINLTTVGLSIAFSQHTAQNYRLALTENEETAQLLASFSALRESALRANAVTIRAFVSQNPQLEQSELATATSNFEVAALRCEAALRKAPPDEAVRLRSDLAEIRLIQTEMTEWAKTILVLARDHRNAAASRLPMMESAFVHLVARIDQVSGRARSDQLAAFARQSTEYSRLLRNGIFLSALIALFVTAATFYGIRVARELGSAREREEQRRLLRASLDLLIEAERMAKIGTWIWDVSASTGRWSDELFRIFGMEPVDHVDYATYLAIVHPEDRSAVQTIIEDAIRERQPYAFDHRVVRGDGEVRIIRLRARLECDAHGKIVRLIGVAHDITEQQMTIDALQSKEIRLEEAQRLAHIGSWDWIPSTAQGTWSEELYRITGCNPATTLPTADSYEALIHPDDRAAYEQRRNEGFARRQEDMYQEHRLVRPDGRIVHVALQSKLQYAANGDLLAGIGTVQDVTESRRATEEVARMSREMKLVLDSAAEGIFGLDSRGRIHLANAAGAQLIGWKVADLIGKSPHTLIHHTREDGSPYLEEECPIRMTMTSAAPQRRRELFWRKDGASIPVEWASNPIFDGEGRIAGAVITFSDITEQLAIERMKDEFVSTVSHELRTPLTSIRGSLGLLAAGRFGAFSDKAQRLLDIAVGNTDRLVKLINDILDIEKLDSGQIRLAPRPTAVAETLAHAVDGVRPLLDRAEIHVTIDAAHEIINLDPDRIGQTLTNLLSNAIKFSPTGSTIRIAAERRNDTMLFSVRDEGRGIPADKLDAIFERFQQVDASDSRDKGGSGLGLSICRSIVQQHGGEIWVESDPGRGSTFFFSIPAQAGSRAA